MTITFDDEAGQVVTVARNDMETWMDAMQLFFQVLRGAGYNLSFDDDEAIGTLNDLNDEARK